MARTMTTVMFCLGLAFASGCTQPREPDTSSGGGASVGGPADDGGSGGSTSESVSSTGSLSVVNNSSITVYYLYVSPSSSSSWGADQLGSHVISPGHTFSVTNIPCGRNYDLKIEGSGHTSLATRYGVYMSCGSALSWRLTN